MKTEEEAKGQWIGKREGGRKFAYYTPSFRDRDKQLDIHFLHLPSTDPPWWQFRAI
jgi:sensor domain CHASE-containing protein